MAGTAGRSVVPRAALAAALALATAPAGAAHAAAPARLAGTTVVTGSRAASMTVVLPRAATVRIATLTAHSDNVAVTGNGRVAGLDLRREDGGPTAPHLFAALTNGCYAPRCAAREHIVTTFADRFPSSPAGGDLTRYTLPAGRYRLVLIADGVPVTVRLRLDGLGGTSTLRPATATGVTWDPLEPNLDAGPAPATVAYSAFAGALPVSDRGGVLFTVFDVRVAAGDVGKRGFCYYPGSAAARTYAAGCPGGGSDSGETITGPIPQQHTLRALQMVDGTLAAGTGSTGLYYDNAAVVQSIDALSVRIPYV
jgi:hypothetical protein